MKFLSTNNNINEIKSKACFIFAYSDKKSISIEAIDTEIGRAHV